MVLEEKHPEGIPPGSEAKTSILARGAGFLQGQLETLDRVVADVVGSLRLINDLDLFASIAATVNKDFRSFHISLFQQFRR